ncbi:MAG: urate oxidase [Pirellulaceae bacterium]|nr:urate oxidase [Pirellulaceae bacterium]
MNVQLQAHSYGKSQVRFTKVTRQDNFHHLVECTAHVQLEGQFEETYLTGDNCQVIPTDTIKNTVYAVARRVEWVDIENYAMQLTAHFLEHFRHVRCASARIEQICWQRAIVAGQPHAHSFVRGPLEVAKCHVKQSREHCFVESGISGLQVLKTTASGFVGYIVDSYTTLQPTEDRVFATTVDSTWRWTDLPTQCDTVRQRVRSAILQMFSSEYSPSVQYTIYRIGHRVLQDLPEIRDITLAMPNQHRLLVDLSRLGLDNPNAIFCPTDEPYGDISATIGRA